MNGLTTEEVNKRQKIYGLNIIHKRNITFLSILLRQFSGNPLIIILALATFVSYLLGQHVSSYYIFGIIIASILLGLWNEYTAVKTIDNLLKKISLTALVERNNEKIEIPVSQLTIGDIVYLSQGTIIPADLKLIEAKDLEVNQAALTGEAKTVFKTAEKIAETPTDAVHAANLAFMGTVVENGSGKGEVIQIGKKTEFGKIAESTSFIRPTTEFQKGLGKFGDLIVKVILIMATVIFVVNALLGHPLLDSLLFSLAIAVGLTPELLPVIITISLAHGAGKLAKKHIIAKQLISIENLGNMDILCTDKTGTITEGQINVVGYFDSTGKQNEQILQLSLLCNTALIHHKVLGNTMDVSLWEYALKHNINLDKSLNKIDEEPFDYNKKLMYTVVAEKDKNKLIVKGAPAQVLALCNFRDKKKIDLQFKNLNNDGLRLIAVATKTVSKQKSYNWNDLTDLNFEGYISFLDIPKKTAKEALLKLHHLNVTTKIITGDNEIVTQKICREVGIEIRKFLTGKEIYTLSEEELKKQVVVTDVFAEVSPEQKLRIIQTLQKLGFAVGYLGDGVNDLPSLEAADVGISVNSAVDVAKDAASVVLLHKSLEVIGDGITEGRKTFNNTIKYILMATSSNFGNMFSAAGASFFLTFLPMTPLQILLTNGLYDISQMSIPSDNVDSESLLKPRHWNINFIKNYMIFFGPLSSIFDFLTFGVMLFIFHARNSLFQTGWFIESVATEILVVFVIRTARTPFFKSQPGKWLILTCLSLTAIGFFLPYSPFAQNLGFVPLPSLYFGILLLLTVAYLTLVETIKNIFLRKYSL